MQSRAADEHAEVLRSCTVRHNRTPEPEGLDRTDSREEEREQSPSDVTLLIRMHHDAP